MFAETTAALAAAKEAYALVKVLKDARDQSVIDSATGKLNEKITELQILNTELASLYHAEKQITMKLSEENAQIQMFTSQAAEYEIHKTDAGSIVYRSKPSTDNEIGFHYLCASCYQQRVISILQPTGKVLTDARSEPCEQFICPACEATYLMHKIPRKPATNRVTGVTEHAREIDEVLAGDVTNLALVENKVVGR